MEDEDWDYKGPAVRWHDKTRKGYDTFVGYVELHYPKSESLEDWTYYSQLNQRDALRMGVEHFRRSAFCRGSLIWQLNDIWPVQSWAVIDSSGRYKAAAYELRRRLYDSNLLSLERVKEKVRLHWINDEFEVEHSNARIYASAVHIGTGEVLREYDDIEFTLEPGFRGMVGEIDLSGLSITDTMIYAWGHPFVHAWHLLAEPKEMNFAAPGRVLGSNQPSHNNFLDDTIEGHRFAIETDGPVVDMMLSVDGDTGPFISNFFTFDSAGVYEVGVREPITHFEARSLAGEHPTRMTRSPL